VQLVNRLAEVTNLHVHGLCHNLRMCATMKGSSRDVESQYVELAVEVFSMLADATRVRIILALSEGELPVNTLAEVAGKAPAAVSQHLAKLRLARIVSTRHVGTRVFYRLENEHAQELVEAAVLQAEHLLSGVPRHHSQNEKGAVS
jgi:DNA-binding transcriptional ArsR family regulator